MSVTNPVLPLYAAEIERTLRAAGAGHAAARRGVHRPRGARVGTCQLLPAGAGFAQGTLEQVSERGQLPDVSTSGGESVLVVGDDDGLPRAFLNTCRHRGARLVDEPAGHAPPAPVPVPRVDLRLRRLAARARRSPTGLDDFDPACFGLHEVRLAVVEGLVLLDLSGEAPPPQDARRRPRDAHWPPTGCRSSQRARADRLRRRRQLEGDRRELQRVPALPGRAPGAQPALALPVAARRSRARACGAAAR